MRADHGRLNQERAFADQDNFLNAPDGTEITGNRGESWSNEPHQLVWD